MNVAYRNHSLHDIPWHNTTYISKQHIRKYCLYFQSNEIKLISETTTDINSTYFHPYIEGSVIYIPDYMLGLATPLVLNKKFFVQLVRTRSAIFYQ